MVDKNYESCEIHSNSKQRVVLLRIKRRVKMSIKQECSYDETKHSAPPVSLKWALPNNTRNSRTQWVFIRCCGQIGSVNDEGIVRALSLIHI